MSFESAFYPAFTGTFLKHKNCQIMYVDLSIQTSKALERSLVMWDHTVLPATQQSWFSWLYPGIHQYSFYRPAEGGRLRKCL